MITIPTHHRYTRRHRQLHVGVCLAVLAFLSAGLAGQAFAVSSVTLPGWVCAHPDALLVDGFETVVPIPHDPSAGSGGAYPGNISRTISVANYATQPYYLHIPASYRPGHAMPLLVVLHGASGSPALANQDALQLRSDWATTADANGFIVIAPIGLDPSGNGSWNAPPGSPTDYDLIAAAFTDATAAYNIERSRRYLWGFSAGGYVAFDIVMNGLNSVVNQGSLAAYTVNSADMGFACDLYGGNCDQMLAAQTRKVPVDLRVGTQDTDAQNHLALTRADHTRLLAHGWVDGSTVFYTEFNDGHTYTGQLPGAWSSMCRFALTP